MTPPKSPAMKIHELAPPRSMKTKAKSNKHMDRNKGRKLVHFESEVY